MDWKKYGKISIITILGDMGGEIGLMLGASLLTFFEFVDLLANLGYHQLLRMKRKTSEKSDSTEVEEKT